MESDSVSLQDQETRNLLGVYLTDDNQQVIDEDLLSHLHDLGITIIETGGFLPDNTLQSIQNSELFLFIRQNRPFVTSHQLSKNDSLYFEQDLSLINYYREALGNRAAAFGLFEYPDDRSSVTVALMEAYHERLDQFIENAPSVYYRSAFATLERYPRSYTFRSVHFSGRDLNGVPSGVIHFSPADNSLMTISDLKYILEHQVQYSQTLVLLPLSWVLEFTERYEPLSNALQYYSQNQQVILPEPTESKETLNPNWIVILLILLAGSYMIHYRRSPMYQKSAFRYFTMHNFFIEDLLENRLRPFIPGLILFFQHAVLGGILFYLTYSFWFSDLGKQALFEYFPALFILGAESYSFFLLGVICCILLQLMSVCWLHFTNKSTNFKQILALYSWPLQLNLPAVLILVTIYQAGGSKFWIAFFSIVFILIWFIAFNISAIGITRMLEKYRIVYILATVGVHSILLTAFIIAVFIYPPVSEPLRLALALP